MHPWTKFVLSCRLLKSKFWQWKIASLFPSAWWKISSSSSTLIFHITKCKFPLVTNALPHFSPPQNRSHQFLVVVAVNVEHYSLFRTVFTVYTTNIDMTVGRKTKIFLSSTLLLFTFSFVHKNIFFFLTFSTKFIRIWCETKEARKNKNGRKKNR